MDVELRKDAQVPLSERLDNMTQQVHALSEGARRVVERMDAPTVDHSRLQQEHEAKVAEHRKIGKLNSTSLHTTAMREHNLAARGHARAQNALGTPDYIAWAKHATESSIAAERMSKRAYAQEPNGPVKAIPQAKW